MNNKDQNKIYEYRKQHPKCSYCKWSDVLPFSIFISCEAKHKLIAHNAKNCPLYEPCKDEV